MKLHEARTVALKLYSLVEWELQMFAGDKEEKMWKRNCTISNFHENVVLIFFENCNFRKKTPF